MKKLLAVALMAIMLIGCFAGCGGNKAKVKVIDIALTEEQYAFGVDKAQPELLEKVNEFIAKIQEDGTFDEICDKYFGDGTPTGITSAVLDDSKDQLVVATNAQFEPFEYKKGDKFYGIDMEIAKLLADYLGKELVINDMDFNSVCLSVGQHKCDIAMAGLTVKDDRKVYVDFSSTYYTANQNIIVKADDNTFDECETADDVVAILEKLDEKTTIGFQNGTTGQFYVQGDESWGFDGLKTKGKGYSSGSLAVQDLINGNVKYVIIDCDPAAFIVEAINKVS